MAVDVKICGIQEPVALYAAIEAKAAFVGFVFHETSRHLVTPEQAGALSKLVPPSITRTGLFVDAEDDEIFAVLNKASLDLLQLHGNETPERVAEIRAMTGLPVMVALRIATAEHLIPVPAYEAVADLLLFDTRLGDIPTGGTGKTFNWSLLTGRQFKKPWMLAGGLKAENLSEAVRISGTRAVDVSSGVEDNSGHKSPAKIRGFIEIAAQL